MDYQIKILELADRKCPFENWYGGIRDTATRARVRARLTRMESGNFGDWKNVGNGVNELRIDFGPGYRVYYALSQQAIVVLLVGGDKTTQAKDIARAQAIWEENKDAPERLQRDFRG